MSTGDPRELAALLAAYIDGDVVARKVLLDWLEEHDDPRLEAVREEGIDWIAVANALAGEKRRIRNPRRWEPLLSPNVNQLRFQIDCARVGSDVPPKVRQAVQRARREWLGGLFPEIDLV
jgi:hypothetical protein